MTIEINDQALQKCNVSDMLIDHCRGTCGTVVELTLLKGPFEWLATDLGRAAFTAIFAPYVQQYPDVKIIYDGERIDPNSVIYRMHDFEPEVIVGPNKNINLKLKVIEWKMPLESRKIYFGGEAGVVLGSQAANVNAPDFNFSAYAYALFFEEMYQANLLDMDGLNDPDFNVITEILRERLGDYFRRRQAERSVGLIQELRNAGIYPYDGDPKDEIERREREVFDIATHAVSSYSKDFRRAETGAKRIALRLLRESVRHNPDSISHILQAVFNLPKIRQDEFSDLLHKTELGNVISASTLIADRIVALHVLKSIVFDPKHKRTIRERGELDVFVRDNTWMFGEKFHITLPETGLSKVMERVSSDLATKAAKSKIRKRDGKSGRLDVFLGRIVPHPEPNHREYIIIELKRPSLTIGRTELDQIEDYANAMKGQDDFKHTSTTWNFFLMTGDYDDAVKGKITQQNRPVGLALEHANSKVWVKSWAELIRDCEARLHFIQEKLKIEVSADEIEAKIAKIKASYADLQAEPS